MAAKGSAWLVMGLTVAGQISAFGAVTGIDLLSQEHCVGGLAGRVTELGGTAAGYNQTSCDPLDVSVTGTYIAEPWGNECSLTAWSKAGDFRVEAYGEYWFSNARAQSTYVFAPWADVQTLSFELSGSGGGVGYSDETNIQFTLDDLTAGVSMASVVAPLDMDDGGEWWDLWSLAWNQEYALDPAHTYSAVLSAHAGNGDGPRSARLNLEVRPVIPAPGALLLAVVGTALVGFRRRSIAW